MGWRVRIVGVAANQRVTFVDLHSCDDVKLAVRNAYNQDFWGVKVNAIIFNPFISQRSTDDPTNILR
jgi:hypothetical protein